MNWFKLNIMILIIMNREAIYICLLITKLFLPRLDFHINTRNKNTFSSSCEKKYTSLVAGNFLKNITIKALFGWCKVFPNTTTQFSTVINKIGAWNIRISTFPPSSHHPLIYIILYHFIWQHFLEINVIINTSIFQYYVLNSPIIHQNHNKNK